MAPSGYASNVLQQIARSNRAPVAASVVVHGTTVTTTPAREGLRLDRAALLRRLALDRPVLAAPYVRLRPPVGDAAAEAAASEARTLLARPVAIDYHGARLGALTPAQTARALRDRRSQRSGSTASGSRR